VAAVNEHDLDQALSTLGLTPPVTLEQLAAKRRELLHAWHPARYANLTNNPKKYMQKFKQAEEMTSRIETACRVVNEWLATQRET
jgi:hypothetical protein